MNAATKFDLASAKLADAIERANEWVNAAQPIIKAYLALDLMDGDLCAAGYDGGLIAKDAANQARGQIGKAVDEFYAIIENVRELTISEAEWRWTPATTEAEEDAGLAFNEALEAETVTVEQAIKREVGK